MKKYIYLIFAALVILESCKDDNREFPAVTTSAEISVVDDGVFVHGSVEQGGMFDIVDYGFVYYKASSNGGNYDQVSLGDNRGVINFSTKIERNLKPGETYILKAYVRTGSYIVFGNPQSFVSKGGKAPELAKYAPLSTWIGDTLTISGKYFSDVAQENNVYFNKIVTHPFFSNDSVIKVVVPASLETADNTIKVEVGGKSSSFPNKFEVALPVINEISPGNVMPGERILVKGKGLSAITGLIVDQSFISTESVSDTSVSFSLDYRVQPGTKILKFNWLGQIITINKTYKIVFPEITSVSPQVAWLDDILTIKGNRMDLLTNFRIGGINLQEVSKNDSVAKLRVVSIFNTATINARFHGYEVETGIQVNLDLPVITSITPSIAHAGDQVTLKGERFFYGMAPSIGNLQVKNSQEAVLTLPWELSAGQHTIDLEYGFDVSIGTVSFTVPKIKILDYYPKQIQRGDTVSVVVENLPENLSGAYWCAFDSRGGEIISRSDDVLKVTVPSNVELSSTPTLSVFFGGQEDHVTNAFVLTEKWESIKNTVDIKQPCVFSKAENGEYVIYQDGSYVVVKKFNSDYDEWRQVDRTDLGLSEYIMPLGSFALGNDLYYINTDNGIYAGSSYEYGLIYKFSLSQRKWSRLNNFPIKLSYKTPFVFVSNGIAYMGTNEGFYAYDSQSDSWVEKAKLPSSHNSIEDPLVFSSSGKGFLCFKTSIINKIESKEFWEYDIESDQWTELPSIPVDIYSTSTATEHDGTVYIAGRGYYPGNKFISFDPLSYQSKELIVPPGDWYQINTFVEGDYLYFLTLSDYNSYKKMYKIPIDLLNQ